MPDQFRTETSNSSVASSNTSSNVKTPLTISRPTNPTLVQHAVPKSPSSGLLEKPEIKKIMDSDVAINALLLKLKQSLLICEEFAKYIRKKYLFEAEHTQELSKQYKHFFITSSGSSSLQKVIHSVLDFDGKLAQVKNSYLSALQKMYDEISSLLFTITKTRKSIKENGKRLEKDVIDSIHNAEKAQARYNSLCQDWEKLRTVDPAKTKLTLRGSKTTKEQEEELLRKIDSADLDYKQKVDHSNALRDTFITKERPKIVLELRDLILELNTAIAIQVQKYTIWTENLILNSGVTVSPIDKPNASMKAIASSVTNERDLYHFLNKYNSPTKSGLMVNQNLIPVKYKKYPSMVKTTTAQPMAKSSKFSSDSNRNSTQKKLASTQSNASLNSTPVATPSTFNRNSNPEFYTDMRNSRSHTSLAGQQQNETRDSGTIIEDATTGTISSTNNDFDNISNNSSNFHSLDPGKKETKLSSFPSLLLSDETGDLDRPLSHVQTDTTLPPGITNNFKTFGVPLENLIEYEQDMVPAIVRQCIYVVDTYGLKLEGIYRKSANVLDIGKLKDEIDKDPANISMILPPNNYSDSDIYLVGSLLKSFFSSLPNSLLPRELVPEIKTCLAIEDPKTRKNYMHGLLYKLPDAQYWTLRSLLFHLKRVLANEKYNRMNLKALCIIWGPTIVPPNGDDINDVNYQIKTMEVLIDVADQAFEPE